MTQRERVLIVEDDEGVAYLQRQRLERAGYRALTARTCQEALDQIEQGVDIIVLDYRLPNEMTGLEFYETLKARGYTLPVIMVTGYSEEATVIKALRDGVRDFVPKTSHYLDYLAAAVDRVLREVRTERQLAESEAALRQAQKMEALGRLAGGVAHEFNNLLQIIQGYASCAAEKTSRESEIYRDLHEVLEASSRASSITRQLLAFGRRQSIRRETVDLRSTIVDLTRMLRPLFGKHIELQLQVDQELAPVAGDSALLGQAVMNLCLNARDAMEQGGTLRIEADQVAIRDQLDDYSVELAPGAYARIRVADTGTGIAPPHLPHLFEPFFTTKPVEKGTGLGLATVFGIVKEHGGTIEVDSEVGRGTVFTIHLPMLEGTANLGESPRAVATGGNETILVAEDEPAIRHYLALVLKRAGYNVLTACDGVEAAQLFRERKDDIAMVLLDIVMPRQTGRNTLQAIRAIEPGVKAMFISGYDPQAGQAAFAVEQGLKVLQKPIDRNELLLALRTLLDQPVERAVSAQAS